MERHHGYRGSTKKALNEVGKVDAVYFQGAVLDPIKVLDKIDRELKTTAVASNPSDALVYACQARPYLSHCGFWKLLAEWPALIEK